MMAQQRRASILHSSLSDTEDDSYSDKSHDDVDNIRATLNAFSFAGPSKRSRNDSNSSNMPGSNRSSSSEHRAEGALLANRNGDGNGRRM